MHRLPFTIKILSALLLLLCASCDTSQEKPLDTGAQDRPVNVPDDVLTTLDGKLGFYEGEASGTIYNGSDWVLIDMDVEVTKTKSAEKRKFRLPFVEKKNNENRKIGSGTAFYIYPEVPLKPFSSGEVRGNSGDFVEGLKKDDFSWGIVSARGYKP
jgi:hypothetical protein